MSNPEPTSNENTDKPLLFKCPKCETELEPASKFCGHCGATLVAGKKRRKYKAGQHLDRKRNQRIAGGRNILLILGILHLLFAIVLGLLSGVADPSFIPVVIVGLGAPGLIFIGLYVWARSNSLPALIAGMATYLTFLAVTIIFFPQTLVSPIMWIIRLAIIGSLTGGIKSAKDQRRLDQGLPIGKELRALTAKKRIAMRRTTDAE